MFYKGHFAFGMSTDNRLKATRREAALTMVQAGETQDGLCRTERVKTYFGGKANRLASGLDVTMWLSLKKTTE